MIRAVAVTLLYLGMLAGALFGAAGRLDWVMGWWIFGGFAAFVLLSFLCFDRQLLLERTRPGPGVRREDVALSTLGFLALYPGTLAVSAFDVARFGWTPPLPLAVQLGGLFAFAAGYAFAFWAVLANPFFSTFVRIQEDRGHRLVDTGPYAWVRHPGYAGALFAHLGLPLALGSRWGVVPALVGIALFVARTAAEDSTLARELEGYAAYRHRVRWRLAPGVW